MVTNVAIAHDGDINQLRVTQRAKGGTLPHLMHTRGRKRGIVRGRCLFAGVLCAESSSKEMTLGGVKMLL